MLNNGLHSKTTKKWAIIKMLPLKQSEDERSNVYTKVLLRECSNGPLLSDILLTKDLYIEDKANHSHKGLHDKAFCSNAVLLQTFREVGGYKSGHF